ncbi:hypothetical protein JHK87_044697 [Glycine soja]|nr:hypothetical protein JHK87_044697 [Glycine soja]
MMPCCHQQSKGKLRGRRHDFVIYLLVSSNRFSFWIKCNLLFARCFRDENLRADRQLEFTQLDMEMTFTPYEDMLTLNEELIRKLSLAVAMVGVPENEKTGPEVAILTPKKIPARFWRPAAIDGGKRWSEENIFSNNAYKSNLETPKDIQQYSNSALKKGDIYNEAFKSGAKGLPFLKVLDDGNIEGISVLVSSMDPTTRGNLLRRCSTGPSDLILFAVGHHTSVNKTLDRLRVYVAHDLGLVDHGRHSVLWITNFPMFEWNDPEQRLEALHHPFIAPNPEDMNDLASARALAYDMVYNGVEIDGGSLRIYKCDIQQKVLEIVGISMEHVSGALIGNNDYVTIPVLSCLFIYFASFYIYKMLQCCQTNLN